MRCASCATTWRSRRRGAPPPPAPAASSRSPAARRQQPASPPPHPCVSPAAPPHPLRYRSAARYKDLIASADKALSAATGKAAAQAKALKALRGTTRALRPQLGDADGREADEQLEGCSAALQRVQSIKPDTGSVFVRLFLGQVNVRVASSEDRRVLKDEYEKFRFRTNFGFIIFPLVWILDSLYLRNVWKHTHWLNILTHVWLLYYYVSLALRTNILKVVR